MRRFASVFALRKPSSSASESSTDDQNSGKKSWRKWLHASKQQQQQQHQHHQQREERQTSIDDEVDELDTSTLLALTRDSLTAPSPSSVSPFAQPEGPVFPRSVNVPLLLPRPQSLRVRVLKSALLRHHNRSSNSGIPPLFPPSSDLPNISHPKAPVQLASQGIHRWITRPCFEERYLVYLPSPSGIQPKHVSASLAIAALEYPEHLDIMAHPDLFVHQNVPKAATPSHPGLLSVTEPPQTPVPSPLRKEHLPPASASAPTLPTSDVTVIVSAMSPTSPVKRIVRFAQDDDDDDSSDDTVPLHFIRQKNKRQEKVKFLQRERLRRGHEDDKERKKQKKEVAEQEKQRLLLEAERAQAEKERKEREHTAYAEEVVKTRMRREMQRAGGVPALVMRERENNFGVSSSVSERNKPPLAASSSASLRGVASSSANPPSDSLSHAHQLQATSDSSPSSSRPSSLLAPSPVSQSTSPRHQSHSRPPSTYSSSSESGGKRNSFMVMPSAWTGAGLPPMMPMTVPMPTYAVPSPMIMTYPPFATSNPNLSYMTPVVPSFPDYMASDFDMPLLPPAAPFMKQPSYERRKSSASASGSEGFASTPASTDSLRRGSFSSTENFVPSSAAAAGKQERWRQGPVLSGTLRKSSDPVSSLGRDVVQSSSQSQRSASGPASSSSNDRSRFSHSMPVKSATMPPIVPSPWTGVPTARQMQMETQLQARGMSTTVGPQLVPGGVGTKASPKSTDVVDGGSATQSGGSSSTATRRAGPGVVNNRASYGAWNQRQLVIS